MSIANPSHARLLADLEAPDLQAGIETGRWRILDCVEGSLVVEIRMGDTDDYLAMKLDVTDYPAVAPAGVPWDLDAKSVLATAKWPVWPRADMGFRLDWSPANANAPYWAWDRVGLATHPDWATIMKAKAWHPGRTILHYLRETEHELETATAALVDA